MTKKTLTVPDIGGADKAEVIELCVAVGDVVSLEQSLIVLESDKATMEIPAEQAGTVLELLVKEGDNLVEGNPMLVLEAASGGQDTEAEPAVAPAAQPEPTPAPASPEPASPEPAAATQPEAAAEPPAAAPAVGADTALPYAGPAVRKLAREFGVDLSQVAGSGPSGRILREDVHDYVKRSLARPAEAAAPAPVDPGPTAEQFAAFGEISEQPMSRIDRLTAANMERSWQVPRVTQFDEVDITELEDFRAAMKAEAEQRETALSPLPFLFKACAAALQANPKLNASLAGDGKNVVYKDYVHIGMAVDTPAGLMVPVIRDVDRKSLWELAEISADLAQRARDRKLRTADMEGASFTISSLGKLGGTGFTPIINVPQVAILGVARLALKPHWNGSEFEPRKMLPLSLAYDHRLVNGADAGRFMTRLNALLSDIRRLLL